MCDGLLGLGHDVIVGCHDDDGDVGNLCTAGTHGRESLVTRRVQEGHVTAVLKRDVVGTDVLGDTTRLTGNHVGLAYVVEQ